MYDDDERRARLARQPAPAGFERADLPIGTRLRRSRGSVLEVCDYLDDEVVLRVWSDPVGWLYRLESVAMVVWAIQAGLYTVLPPDE